ncbi:MAG TPA: dihydrodipicolinate synthase family protein [Chloroflexota bacterium]
MLGRNEIRGICALPPTPCKDGAGGYDAPDSIDMDETTSLIEKLIAAGVGSIGFAGTTGECAALLREEKRALAEVAVQVTRKRLPIIVGATALGTKETVQQMRALKEVGVDGVLVGLPLWQTPTLENSVQFFADLGEAVPDLPIMIYANSMYFKSVFPTEFWAGVARKAPTVIACKVSYGVEHIVEDLDVAEKQINFVVGEAALYEGYQKAGTRITAGWATSAGMGPEAVVALMDAILNDDRARADSVYADLRALPPTFPQGIDFRVEFPKYNAQVNKYLSNQAGFANFGPFRAPYCDLPDAYRTQLDSVAQARKALRQKYLRVAAS